MKRIGLALAGAALLLSFSGRMIAAEGDSPFDIRWLPKGADVTLPHPATTVVPLNLMHRIIPTDYDQVLKVSSNQPSCSLRITVYDSAAPGARTLKLTGSDTVIYRFKKLSTIRVNAEDDRDGACAQTASLTLESNRPLGIGL